jgi:hypothetical protein
MIQIAVLNESTVISNADIRAMLPAFRQQWNIDLQPIWGWRGELYIRFKGPFACCGHLVGGLSGRQRSSRRARLS